MQNSPYLIHVSEMFKSQLFQKSSQDQCEGVINPPNTQQISPNIIDLLMPEFQKNCYVDSLVMQGFMLTPLLMMLYLITKSTIGISCQFL